MSAYESLAKDTPKIVAICKQILEACNRPQEKFVPLADELYKHIHELYQLVYRRSYYPHLPAMVLGALRHLFRTAESYKEGVTNALFVVREVRIVANKLRQALQQSTHPAARKIARQLEGSGISL